MLMGHTRLPCVQGTAGGTCVWKHIQCGKGLRCREGESVSLSAKPAVVRPAEVPSPQGWVTDGSTPGAAGRWPLESSGEPSIPGGWRRGPAPRDGQEKSLKSGMVHIAVVHTRGEQCVRPGAVLRSVAVPTPPGWIRQGCRLSSLLSTLPTQLHLHDQLLPL
jgi:hypothetical protein